MKLNLFGKQDLFLGSLDPTLLGAGAFSPFFSWLATK